MAQNIASVMAEIRALASRMAELPDLPEAALASVQRIIELTSMSADVEGEASDLPQTEAQSL